MKIVLKETISMFLIKCLIKIKLTIPMKQVNMKFVRINYLYFGFEDSVLCIHSKWTKSFT